MTVAGECNQNGSRAKGERQVILRSHLQRQIGGQHVIITCGLPNTSRSISLVPALSEVFARPGEPEESRNRHAKRKPGRGIQTQHNIGSISKDPGANRILSSDDFPSLPCVHLGFYLIQIPLAFRDLCTSSVSKLGQ